jgi:hypothetical protein
VNNGKAVIPFSTQLKSKDKYSKICLVNLEWPIASPALGELSMMSAVPFVWEILEVVFGIPSRVHVWLRLGPVLQDLCRLCKLGHQFWADNLQCGVDFLHVATAPLQHFVKRKILGTLS